MIKVYNVYNSSKLCCEKGKDKIVFVTENFWSQSDSLSNLHGVIWTILAYNTPNLAYLRTLGPHRSTYWSTINCYYRPRVYWYLANSGGQHWLGECQSTYRPTYRPRLGRCVQHTADISVFILWLLNHTTFTKARSRFSCLRYYLRVALHLIWVISLENPFGGSVWDILKGTYT